MHTLASARVSPLARGTTGGLRCHDAVNLKIKQRVSTQRPPIIPLVKGDATRRPAQCQQSYSITPIPFQLLNFLLNRE